MKLKKLLRNLSNIEVRGPKEIDITGLSANSKVIFPGNLFVVKVGKSFDGHQFVDDAIACGATAILTSLYNPTLKSVTQVITSDVSAVEPVLASRYYENPSQELLTIGITGTNGKTTCSYLIRHLLESSGRSTGLLGTIEYLVGDHTYTATHTTPDVISNQKYLREMVRAGCVAAVMEATSHGLTQGRLAEIDFDIALFTNLSQDHLDYHKSMEAYADAKHLLFSGLDSSKTAIVNGDDPWARRVLGASTARILRFGLDEGADIQATGARFSTAGTTFTLVTPVGQIEVRTRLVGRFNLYNCLACAAVGIAQGISLEEIAKALLEFNGVPGRLEHVETRHGGTIIVDFCHTPDALRNVLETLREVTSGRIITVFGCGGDRDRDKRPKMAAVAEGLSDQIVLTSDNPRSEDPQAICDEVATGLIDRAQAHIEVDRRKAIALALSLAEPTDTVLIAGKGHEPYQIFAYETVPFDDRVVAQDEAELLVAK